MTRVLVTGGAGFIGSHLAEALLREGASVRVVDDLSTGRRENLPPGVEFVQADMAEGPLEGIETVFHLAARPSVARSIEDPLETNRINGEGTLRLLRAAARAGVRRVVYASSSSVYGDRGDGPRKEDQPAAPRSPYAVSKLAGEWWCDQAIRHWKLETVTLRLFNVYGPRQDPTSRYAAVVPIFCAKLHRGESLPIEGDGNQRRDFTYVTDVVEGLLRAGRASGISGRTLNLAGGRSWTVLHLANCLQKIAGIRAGYDFGPSRPGDVRDSCADISLLKTALAYVPSTTLEEGLRRTWEAFA